MGKDKELDSISKQKIKFVPLRLCSTGRDTDRSISYMKDIMYNLKWIKWPQLNGWRKPPLYYSLGIL